MERNPLQDDLLPAPLVAEGVVKRYRRTLALDGVSLTVPAGALTALVGPNAAGKSTLIKTFVGFERPSTGRVTVSGLDPVRDRAAVLAHIGYIPQTPALYRELTVADHLDLAARLRPGFDRASAVSRLSALGIPARSRGGELSGGQQAQLTLAVALGSRADILLLDEPLASLDPLARHEFLVLLADVARERRATVLLSSHIVGELGGVCDRLVVLGVGRVLYEGSVADALATHRVRDALAGPDLVATFPSSDGAMHGLFRADDGRPATLDEIALGYLAAGRKPTSADLGWPAA
jgi:ABC-2 type transport system ATP-binding protein